MELFDFISDVHNMIQDLEKPVGTEEHPGRTCRDLKRCGAVTRDGILP